MKVTTKYLIAGIVIVSLAVVVSYYRFLDFTQRLPQSVPNNIEVVVLNGSGYSFSIDKNRLAEYYSRFSDSENTSKLTSAGLQDKSKIEISVIRDKPSPQGAIYSSPPDYDNAKIMYTRYDTADITSLTVFVDQAILDNRTTDEINRIFELQILRGLYMTTHPEELGSKLLFQNVIDQVATIQSEIGSIIN